jgi:hypothetical protein
VYDDEILTLYGRAPVLDKPPRVEERELAGRPFRPFDTRRVGRRPTVAPDAAWGG